MLCAQLPDIRRDVEPLAAYMIVIARSGYASPSSAELKDKMADLELIEPAGGDYAKGAADGDSRDGDAMPEINPDV